MPVVTDVIISVSISLHRVPLFRELGADDLLLQHATARFSPQSHFLSKYTNLTRLSTLVGSRRPVNSG